MVIKWLPNSCCGTGRAVQTPIGWRRAEVRRLPSSKWTKTHWYGAMIASTLYLASITYTYILKASQLTAQLVSLLRSNRILPCTIASHAFQWRSKFLFSFDFWFLYSAKVGTTTEVVINPGTSLFIRCPLRGAFYTLEEEIKRTGLSISLILWYQLDRLQFKFSLLIRLRDFSHLFSNVNAESTVISRSTTYLIFFPKRHRNFNWAFYRTRSFRQLKSGYRT